MWQAVLDFFNGEAFGYLLHALEIAAAEALFSLYLRRRRMFALRIVIAVALLLGLSLGFGLLLGRYAPYLRYLVSLLLSLALFPLCFSADVWDILFCCVAAVASQNFAYSVSGIFAGLCGYDPVAVAVPFSLAQAAVYIAAQAVVFVACNKPLKNLGTGFAQERIPMVLISLILTVVIYIIQLDKQSLASDDFFSWRVMFLSYDVLSLFMLFGLSERSRLRRENAVLDQLRAGEERQYELDKRAVELVNIKCHDLKHQIIALHGMRGEEREKALKDVEDAVMIYDSIAQTGCKPLDLILKSKYLLCEKEGIRFTYMVDGEKLSFLSAVDIYSLFGNALDNAIRACTEVEDKSRRLINMSVFSRVGFLTIHIENSTAKEPVLRNGLPVTTQKDTSYHGYGMLSMRRIAESYGGVMEVTCRDLLFSLDMTIPLRPAPPEEGAASEQK